MNSLEKHVFEHPNDVYAFSAYLKELNANRAAFGIEPSAPPDTVDAERRVNDAIKQGPEAVDLSRPAKELDKIEARWAELVLAPVADFAGDLPYEERAWENHTEQVKFTPARRYTIPTRCLPGPIARVIQGARQAGLRVRAVGKGHSFAEITRTEGYLLDLNNFVMLPSSWELGADAAILADGCALLPEALTPEASRHVAVDQRDGAGSRYFTRVAAGLHVYQANALLWKWGFSLEIMGGADRQTLSGAMSTGTHGSGAALGALHDMVVCYDILDGQGVLHRIQRSSGGPISRAKFEALHADPQNRPYQLHEDDELFHTLLVSAGSAGVIYALTLEVVPRYCLSQRRFLRGWAGPIVDGASGTVKEVLQGSIPAHSWTHARNFELWLSPYEALGEHVCLETWRTAAPGDAKQYNPDTRELTEAQGGTLRTAQRARDLAKNPFTASQVAPIALRIASHSKPYLDRSHRVFNVGTANNQPTWSIEVSVAIERVVPAVEALFKRAKKALDAKEGVLSAPISLRFCRTSRHRLSMLYSSESSVRCVIEIITLLDESEDPRMKGQPPCEPVLKGKTLVLSLLKVLVEQFDGRVHWGQLLPTSADPALVQEVASKFPELASARAILDAFDPGRMFVNPTVLAYGIRSDGP
jgi:hypothetical protein